MVFATGLIWLSITRELRSVADNIDKRHRSWACCSWWQPMQVTGGSRDPVALALPIIFEALCLFSTLPVPAEHERAASVKKTTTNP
jgi:hypothetical protein